MAAWEQQKHRYPHPQHVSVPLDHSWFIMQADLRTKDTQHGIVCSSPFKHVLYFPSPCIELANDPSQCTGLNCNNQNWEGHRCTLFSSAWRRKTGPYLQKFQKNSAVSKIFFIMVLFCFCLFTSALHKQNLSVWGKFNYLPSGCLKIQTQKYLDDIFIRFFCIPPPKKPFAPNKGDWND